MQLVLPVPKVRKDRRDPKEATVRMVPTANPAPPEHKAPRVCQAQLAPLVARVPPVRQELLEHKVPQDPKALQAKTVTTLPSQALKVRRAPPAPKDQQEPMAPTA